MSRSRETVEERIEEKVTEKSKLNHEQFGVFITLFDQVKPYAILYQIKGDRDYHPSHYPVHFLADLSNVATMGESAAGVDAVALLKDSWLKMCKNEVEDLTNRNGFTAQMKTEFLDLISDIINMMIFRRDLTSTETGKKAFELLDLSHRNVLVFSIGKCYETFCSKRPEKKKKQIRGLVYELLKKWKRISAEEDDDDELNADDNS